MSTLEQQAEALAARVNGLYAKFKAGAQEAVTREIGRSPDLEPWSGDEAALQAIARRVMPDGWVWVITHHMDGSASFSILDYQEPKPRGCQFCDTRDGRSAGHCTGFRQARSCANYPDD